MVTPAIGSVVLVPFPFSDLSDSKLRPALVLAEFGRANWICAQMTSNPYSDSKAVELTEAGFASGGLDRTSYIRPAKLFTANETLFRRCVAKVDETVLRDVIEAVVALLRGPK